MKDLVLTDDGNRVLLVLFKEYKRRKKQKVKESDARYFGDEDEVQPLLFPKDDAGELGDICWYLSRKGLLEVLPGDDGYFVLRDAQVKEGMNTYDFGELIVFYDQIIGISLGKPSEQD